MSPESLATRFCRIIASLEFLFVGAGAVTAGNRNIEQSEEYAQLRPVVDNLRKRYTNHFAYVRSVLHELYTDKSGRLSSAVSKSGLTGPLNHMASERSESKTIAYEDKLIVYYVT